jgi:hypothetical protein
MTEAEWVASEDPREMLLSLHGRAGTRKPRLFACACCRRVWASAPEAARRTVALAERYADRPYTREPFTRRELRGGLALADGVDALTASAEECARVAAATALRKGGAARSSLWAEMSLGGDPDSSAREAERAAQAELIRDIFGNPFRPVTLGPEWCTDTAVALARQMYESRDFSAMPILADVLQDAGCDSEGILSHCRGDGPHARGCWVVDLVLGKE